MAHMVKQSTHEAAHEVAANDRVMFGFWVYIMTDLLMFAVLFAVYAVLRNQTAGGPNAAELFSLPLALINTMLLLVSSLTSGLGTLAAREGKKNQVLGWFGVTFLLGLAFFNLELYEFTTLIREGHSYTTSAFLSSFFALVGTHGLHILCGLIWIAVMLEFIARRGLNAHMVRKINLLSLYWHFLDIVWIFIFAMVYLRTFA